MAEEKKEFIALPEKEKEQEYKVLVPFTLDKALFPGNKIYLLKGKLRDTLISNKLIK